MTPVLHLHFPSLAESEFSIEFIYCKWSRKGCCGFRYDMRYVMISFEFETCFIFEFIINVAQSVAVAVYNDVISTCVLLR